MEKIQVNDELNIIERVMIAQNDINAADCLIREYYPFIKSETAKTTGSIPVEGKDDELSVALMGFHEAIENYDPEKGAFISFASMIIRRRIIDFLRHESKFKKQVPLDGVEEEIEESGIDKISGDMMVDRTHLRNEILELTKDLKKFNITISDVAENCPRQKKTIAGCRQVVTYVCSRQEFAEDVSKNGKLPVKHIIKETSVKKKTLERHRKYLIALILVYVHEYDGIMEHLSEVFNFQKGGK